MPLLNDKGVSKLWDRVNDLVSVKVDKELKTNSSTEYRTLTDNNLTDELVQKINNGMGDGFSGNYEDLTNIPASFPPASHNHPFEGILPIENGGTGATIPTDALSNLGLTASAEELNYSDGLTGNIQEQLNNLAPKESIETLNLINTTESIWPDDSPSQSGLRNIIQKRGQICVWNAQINASGYFEKDVQKTLLTLPEMLRPFNRVLIPVIVCEYNMIPKGTAVIVIRESGVTDVVSSITTAAPSFLYFNATWFTT